MLHLLMFSIFIGTVAYTVLYLVIPLYTWPMLAYLQYYCITAGPGWLVFSSIAGCLA